MVAVALIALEIAPPADGAILLVSVNGMTRGAILNDAMRSGALPLQAGPIHSSVIVYGNRNRIIATTLPSGILAFAGGSFCGGKR